MTSISAKKVKFFIGFLQCFLMFVLVIFSSISFASGEPSVKVSLSPRGEVDINGKAYKTVDRLKLTDKVSVKKGTLTLTCWKDENKKEPAEVHLNTQSGSRTVRDECPYAGPKGNGVHYRKGGYENIPYIISPRYTRVTTSTPQLRWNHIGANSYKVALYGGSGGEEKMIWEKNISTEEITLTDAYGITIVQIDYPKQHGGNTFRPLESSLDYYLVVTASINGKNITSKENLKPDSYLASDRFGLALSYENHLQFGLVSNVNRIPESNDPIALVNRLAQHGMYADAIREVENLLQNDKCPDLYRQLGDLYLESGLNLLAKGVYKQAIKTLSSIQDHEQQIQEKRIINASICELDKLNSSSKKCDSI
jgi:hypothetical protein